jgi:hypothetical protein
LFFHKFTVCWLTCSNYISAFLPGLFQEKSRFFECTLGGLAPVGSHKVRTQKFVSIFMTKEDRRHGVAGHCAVSRRRKMVNRQLPVTAQRLGRTAQPETLLQRVRKFLRKPRLTVAPTAIRTCTGAATDFQTPCKPPRLAQNRLVVGR